MSLDHPSSPKILSGWSFAVAIAIHLAFFAAFWLFAVCHGFFDKKEEIIPIDLTVVVNQNLDGKENEPPPLKKQEQEKPKPKPPKPKPTPKPPEQPKELEKIVTNIVAQVKTPEKKPPETKKPKEKKKTAKELREERLRQMRDSAKDVKAKVVVEVKNAPSGNGRTERQTRSPEEIRRLLEQGYRPDTKTQIAPNIRSRCLALIKRALDEKWAAMSPTVGASGVVLLSVQFNSNGGMINVRLTQGCGDRVSDAAALSVAKSISYIPGLDAEFIAESKKEPLTVRYTVKGK